MDYIGMEKVFDGSTLYIIAYDDTSYILLPIEPGLCTKHTFCIRITDELGCCRCMEKYREQFCLLCKVSS